MSEADRIRLDKWLFFARFFKTRSLSSKQIEAGHVRVNATKVLKPATSISIGQVLTVVHSRTVRVVEVLALGHRRGPASEAQLLYRDLTPKQDSQDPAPGQDQKGRPTKRERRALRNFRNDWLE
ncbi:RNA-binding S4 domain-containing protein [Rhodobacteraceae bacterium IMCC1335]